jgi:pimeloyl-ACP methyl ester carboxylesterase
MINKRYIIITVLIAFVLLATMQYAGTFTENMYEGDIAPQLSTDVHVMPSVQYADVNGVTLGYREYGAGEPLLLICGFGATMDNWNATFISILASQFHVYVYDHRGMGYSGDNNDTPSISRYADDAFELMHALGYTSMNTYGTSMGSSISQQLVISHPECVRKMVLSSSSYSIRIPETATLLNIIESIAADPNQSQGLRNEALANLAWNGSYDGLAGIDKPTMLIVGTNDILTPDTISVHIAGQINGSWLVRFSGIPHSGQSYAPIQYAEAVMIFLGMNESPYAQVAPGTPNDLIIMTGDGKALLSWSVPYNDGGSSITGYTVYRCTTSGGNYFPVASVNGTSYDDSNLDNGQVYWYKVSATNVIGEGSSSTSTSVTLQNGNNSTPFYLGLASVLIATIALVVVMTRRKR